MSAEAEAIGEGVADGFLDGVVKGVVEVAFGVIGEVVNGGIGRWRRLLRRRRHLRDDLSWT